MFVIAGRDWDCRIIIIDRLALCRNIAPRIAEHHYCHRLGLRQDITSGVAEHHIIGWEHWNIPSGIAMPS